jgi:hypothetical protein
VSTAWPRVRLGEVLIEAREPAKVQSDAEYPNFGIYSFGRGLFLKPNVSGLRSSATTLFRVRAGQIIYSRLFAFEGAYGLVTDEFDGHFVSNEYPAFEVLRARLLPEYAAWFLRSPRTWEEIAERTTGMGDRRRRVQVPAFLAQEIPLPPIAVQQAIVSRIDDLLKAVEEAGALQREIAVESGALHAAFLARLSRGLPPRRLADLLTEPPRNGLGPRREVPDGLPMLRISSVSSSSNRFVDTTAVKRVEVEDASAAAYTALDGDVFVVRYNGDIKRLARAAVFKSDGQSSYIYPDKLIRLRPKSNLISSDFLAIAFGSPRVRERIEAIGKTTAGNVGISGRDLRSLEVPVPPPALQSRIVSQIDALGSAVAATVQRVTVVDREMRALKLAILDRAFGR